MPQPWVERPVEWTIKDIGAPLLDSIARGLYSQLEVFREYVQNAVDSYADFEVLTGMVPTRTVQALVDAENASLQIMDRGVGMDWDDIRTAKSIAVSPKLARSQDFVGFRGIGIWSGLSACDHLELVTSKAGVGKRYKLIINCKGIVEHMHDPLPIDEVLRGRFTIHESDEEPSEHYTFVKLKGVHRDGYGALLDLVRLRQYAQEYLPVPFDPQWSYSGEVRKILDGVPFTTEYEITLNGEPVYRQFPSPADLKPPQRFEVVTDKEKREVGVGWFCETARTGARKALDRDKVRNFAIRIKNFAIGERGVYSNHSSVTDAGNLDWYVGEIYITDADIRPDSKRALFEPSQRHDAAVEALRKRYSSIALRARGWSQQVVVEDACAKAHDLADQIQHLIASGCLSNTNGDSIDDLWEDVKEIRQIINPSPKKTKNQAAEPADSTKIVAEYLRKTEVRSAVSSAMHAISKTEAVLKDKHPVTLADQASVAKQGSQRHNGASSRPRSKALTANLHGTPVSPMVAVEQSAAIGSTSALIDLESRREEKQQRRLVPLEDALEAFRAAVAAVLGDTSESYQRIIDRLPEELRRRGIDAEA